MLRHPPVIRTLPSGSSVAVCMWRGVFMSPVAVNVRVEGSYNSELAHTGQSLTTVKPPAIKTLPLVSNVAVWFCRGTFKFPVGVNVPGDCASPTGTLAATAHTSGRRKFSLMFAPGIFRLLNRRTGRV